MPLYPTLGGQLWAIAREYGLPSIGGLVIFLADDGNGNPGPRVGEATWTALWGNHFQDQDDYEEEEEEEDGESYENFQDDREGLTEEEERMEMEIRSAEDWNENAGSSLTPEEVHSNANSTSADSPSETNSSSAASPDARLQRRYLSRAPMDSSEGKARRAAALKAAKEQARIEAGKLEEEEESDSSASQSTHDGPNQQSGISENGRRSRSGTFNPNSRTPMPYAHQSNSYINGNGRSASQSYSNSQSQSYSNSSPASRSASSRFATRGGGVADKSNTSSRSRGGDRSKGSNSTSNSTSRQSRTRSRQSQRSNTTTNGTPSLPIIGRIEWAVERNRAQGQWWNSWIDQAAQIQAQAQERNLSYSYNRRALNSSADDGSNSSPLEEQDLTSSSRKENARRSLHLLNSANLTPRSQIQQTSRNLQQLSSSPNERTLMSVTPNPSTQLQSRIFDHPRDQSQPQQMNARNSIGSVAQSTRSTNLSGSDEQLGALSQPRSSMRFSIADSRVGNGNGLSQVGEGVQDQFVYSNRASSVLNDGYAFGGSKSRSERGLSLTSNSTGAVQPLSATRESFGEDLARLVKEREVNLEGNQDLRRKSKVSDHSSNADVRGNHQLQESQTSTSINPPIISSDEMEGILNSRRNSNSSPLKTKDPSSFDSESQANQSLGVQGLGLRADMNQSSSRTPSIRSGGDSASYAGFSALMSYQGAEGENDGSAINGLSSGGGNGRERFFGSSDDGKVEDDAEDHQDPGGQYAALEDDDDEEERAVDGTEEHVGLPSGFHFNARAIDDDQGDEGMWRSLQDEKPSSLKDHLSGTGTGDHTHRQSFTPSFGDHFNPLNNPSLSPSSLQAHLSAADRERSREREKNGTVSPEALAVHDWIQKTSAPALSNLNGMEDEDVEDEGVLPPEDDVADVLDLWARKITSGEELPPIQEGNSYESSIHGAMAEKVQQLAAERAANSNANANANPSQYQESLTKPQSEKASPDQNLISSSNQAETSLLSPIALETGTFGGPKPQLTGTDSSSIPSPRLASSDGSNAQLLNPRELTEEPESQGGLTTQSLSINSDNKHSSPLRLNAPTSPGGRSMTSSTDSLGDLERALDLLSPVVSNHGESAGFQASINGKGKPSRPFEKMSSRDSLAAARTLSTSVTPSPRWLSKNKSISSVKLSPRPASASAIGFRPDVITSRVAASRIRTQAPASSRKLAKVGDSLGDGLRSDPGGSDRFKTQFDSDDFDDPSQGLKNLPSYKNRHLHSQDGDWNEEHEGSGGIRSAYEVVMNGRPALNRKGSRSREMEEDGINSAPEEFDYRRDDSVASPISAPDRALDFPIADEGSYSKQSSPEIGFDGFTHYQDNHMESQPRIRGSTSQTSSLHSPNTTSRFQDSRAARSPSSSKNNSPQLNDDENDQTMAIHSERSSINRPFGEGLGSLQPSQSDVSGGLTRTNSHPDLSAANSDTHHEDGPDFKMESRRVSRELLGGSSPRSRDPTETSPNTPSPLVHQFGDLADHSPEARDALIAQYIKHGRGGSVASIENPSSIKR